VVERLVMLKEGQVAADGPTQRILSDEAVLNTIGLDVPEPIRLLRALRQKGKKVRTDLVSAAEAAAEIAHVWGLPHAQRGWANLPFAGEEGGGA
jgi:hypothetical protein